MNAESPSPNRRAWFLAFLVVVVVGFLQLSDGLGQIDFHHEEGRRVLPAREMIASGDWISPTLLGRPYLSKPPGIYWLLGGLFQLTGHDSVVVARSLSVAATLATLVLLLWVGARKASLRAGLFAAFLLLGSTEALTKARLAEIEASLALAVCLSVIAWWIGRRGSLVWTLVSGLALAAAILLKGPAALLFFVGPPIALAWRERSAKSLLSPRTVLPLLVGLALPGLWLLAYFGRVDSATATNHWGGQIGGQGGRTLAMFAGERVKFVLGTVLACLPASLLLLVAIGTKEWKRLWGGAISSHALAAFGIGWLFFAVFPGTSVRYLYPVMPLLALVMGIQLDRLLRDEVDPRYRVRVERVALAFLGLGVVGFAATVVGYFVELGDVRISLGGVFWGVALLGSAVAGWKTSGLARFTAAFVLVPLVFGHLLTSQVEPSKATRHRREVYARTIDQALQDDDVLRICTWSNFNMLCYLEHEYVLLPSWQDLESDDKALVSLDQLDAMNEWLDPLVDYEILAVVRFRHYELAVIHLRTDALEQIVDPTD